MMPTVERGRSFDAWADEYDRYRPTYPGMQDRFRRETLDLLARHGHRGDDPFTVPYPVDLWTARRRES